LCIVDKEKESMSNKSKRNPKRLLKNGIVDRSLWKPSRTANEVADLAKKIGERSQLNGLARTGAV
jgi:hypothetical protein